MGKPRISALSQQMQTINSYLDDLKQWKQFETQILFLSMFFIIISKKKIYRAPCPGLTQICTDHLLYIGIMCRWVSWRLFEIFGRSLKGIDLKLYTWHTSGPLFTKLFRFRLKFQNESFLDYFPLSVQENLICVYIDMVNGELDLKCRRLKYILETIIYTTVDPVI